MQQKGYLLTRTRAFKRLLKWSFDVCDHDKTGEVGKTELYAGVLLVHLNLAKYCGPAACFVSFENEFLALCIVMFLLRHRFDSELAFRIGTVKNN